MRLFPLSQTYVSPEGKLVIPYGVLNAPPAPPVIITDVVVVIYYVSRQKSSKSSLKL